MNEGLAYGEKAQAACRYIEGDDYPYIKSLAGMGSIDLWTGKIKKALECGKTLLRFGETHGNIRSLALGYLLSALSHLNAGEKSAAIEDSQQGLKLDADTLYLEFLRWGLGYAYVMQGRFQEAEVELQQVVSFSEKYGLENFGWSAASLLGMVVIARGQMAKGLKKINEIQDLLQKNGLQCFYVLNELLYGHFYTQLATRATPLSASLLIKNIGFILRHSLSAAQKAIAHYTKTINMCKESGNKAMSGMAHFLHLGTAVR